ncbi:MAG TPA: CDP-diacylglycerol--glycerol-3-phosphate 3-phosphatidyltransferase [Candidatus Limnocylindria bacterium]|nr:CDP-diacylglycerol--glycerol-3-phosphate 3-phosphatidyltransferase [Candidatus Limnocylindria bacterium]
MADPRRGSVATLPNLLGIGRILATPVIMALLLADWPGSSLAGGVLFVVAALTDFLDGWIARARNQVSPLGVFMDLAADKVLVAGVLIAMVEIGLVPTWMAATILIREFVVQAVRQLAAVEDVVISARALGKAKTLTTLVGLALLFLASDAATGGPLASPGAATALDAIGFWVMVVATLLTVVSGLVYLRGAWPILVGSAT